MSQKFGLGRGLADLKAEMGSVPEISVLAGGERVVVRHIPISQIVPNPDQPRKTFASAELEDLANSIREKGVLQPILVRTDRSGSSATGGQYEIVAGERRWRASQMAGLKEIPALVKTVTPENAMEIALIENVQRENLNSIEEAAAYKNLMESCGYEMGDVVKLIGKSESYIRNIMRLSTLPKSVQKMVEDGHLSASHARTIAVADDPDALAKKVIEQGLSVADTVTEVKSRPRSSKSRSFRNESMSQTDIREYERKLESALSVPVQIKLRKGGAGELALRFVSKLQMEQLIELLTKN
ncbi:MAG: ParB/RepB/Spo0J family partition protein [Alphaproteobacteria bacterium]|nr:ParB/RepB/Spo0J family partition protein [Alphaproteobacteria bacterium]